MTTPAEVIRQRICRVCASRRSVVRSEDGYVMLIVLGLLVIGLAMAAAGVASSLASRSADNRTSAVARAQQAADAGIQTQRYQQSEVSIGNVSTSMNLNGGLLGIANGGLLDCVVPSLNASLQITGLTQVAAVTGTCPGHTGGPSGSAPVTQALGHNAYVQSEFFPGATTPIAGSSEADLAPKIVSLGWTGTSTSSATGNIRSREMAILAPLSPLPVLGANGNLTVSGVTLSGGLLGTVLGLLGLNNLATTINGDVQATNNLTLPAIDASLNLTLSNGLLGVARYGGTLTPSNGIAVAQVVHSTPPSRQAVTVSPTTPSCPVADASVPRQASCADFSSYYTASTDVVNVPSGHTMTLPGGNYVFCNFTANGAVNAFPTGNAPVRIFIDSPQSTRCANNHASQSGSPAVWSVGNFYAASGINCSAANLCGTVFPSGIQVYVVGDGSDATTVQIGTPPSSNTLLSTNPASEGALIYAPSSSVSMTTAQCVTVFLVGQVCVPGTFAGSIVGQDVNATALTFTQDLDLGNYPLYNGINVYTPTQYVECTPVSSLAQDSATDTANC
jgi:type II secretory pathway pseudopilin PulG